MLVPADGDGALFTATAAGDKVADPIMDTRGWIVLSKDGTIATSQITNPPQTLIDGPGFALSPTMSDDRKRLVFTTDRAGNRELWMLVDPAGINPLLTYEY